MTHFHDSYQPSATIKIPSARQLAEFPALFVEMHGKRLHLEAKEPVSPSTAVTVECEDAMFLGEVIAVSQENGRYQIEVAVEQVLSGLQSLMALRSQLLGEGSPLVRTPTVASEVVSAR